MAPPDSCLVVGAGISGLLVASELRDAGVEVTVLEEGQGVGGRMATRRFGDASFDHGSQFFTVRGERFAGFVDGWLREGVAVEWSRGFPTPEESASDGHPRYRGADGMTAIPKSIASGLDVRIGERVTRVGLDGGRWRLSTESGAEHTAQALLVTAPAPQGLALVESGGFRLEEGDRAALEGIAYDPCLALMVRLENGAHPVPEPGGLQIKSEPLDWISDNQRKGISAAPGLTVHAGPQWSRQRYEATDEEVIASLLPLASETLGVDLDPLVRETELSRWPYSWVTQPYSEPCLAARADAPLLFAGDGFGQAKVEGAALSGLAAADRLLDRG